MVPDLGEPERLRGKKGEGNEVRKKCDEHRERAKQERRREERQSREDDLGGKSRSRSVIHSQASFGT